MTELTKEHLDQQLKKLATKEELKHLATKKDLEEQTEQLATIVNTAFQQQKDHVDQRFDKVEEQLQTTKLDRALYTQLKPG
jgi:alkylhydroperoxidase/carboxymuconolactone decarboxylase family protein YurZ